VEPAQRQSEAVAQSRSVAAFLKGYRLGIDSARGLVLLKTETNNQLNWLQAGRSFARFQLTLTQLGLTSHQEFPEMAVLQAEFNDQLGSRSPRRSRWPSGSEGASEPTSRGAETLGTSSSANRRWLFA
jgi:hypothetical protein